MLLRHFYGCPWTRLCLHNRFPRRKAFWEVLRFHGTEGPSVPCSYPGRLNIPGLGHTQLPLRLQDDADETMNPAREDYYEIVESWANAGFAKRALYVSILAHLSCLSKRMHAKLLVCKAWGMTDLASRTSKWFPASDSISCATTSACVDLFDPFCVPLPSCYYSWCVATPLVREEGKKA